MNTRNININVTLEKAREWYNSGNAALKEIALQAFCKNELVYNFKDIKTFRDACVALNLSYDDMYETGIDIAKVSKASAAMFKLNIIRKALNMGQNLCLTKNPGDTSIIWYPYNPFVINDSAKKLKSKGMEIIGKIKNEKNSILCS